MYAITLSWHFFVLSQQFKHQNHVWNLFKTNNYNWRHSVVFIVNFEPISYIDCSDISVVDYE